MPSSLLVDEGGALPEQSPVAFEGQANDRIEQRMARADKCSQRLSRRGHQGFLESDALVCPLLPAFRLPCGGPVYRTAWGTRAIWYRFGSRSFHGSAELLERIPEDTP